MENDGLDEIRVAREELEEVIREIQSIPGYEDFLEAPTFDDVADAAEAQPLVYLAATEFGGLALVVRGEDVAHVPLDGLTSPVLYDQVTAYFEAYNAFRAAKDKDAALPAWRAAIDAVTAWLWSDVMGPVVAEVRPASSAVLVAGGLLGLLPLHAAWTPTGDAVSPRRYVLDDLVITYAPNARSLSRARELAARPAERLLAVLGPPEARERAFDSAPIEAEIVAGHFGENAKVMGGRAGTAPREVGDAMREADVVHFACHGFARPESPLDSGLDLIAGQALTLRDIFPLDLALRLVVLSACETSLPGTELPDEVVALPTGLLQAGVGGVVASLWLIDDLPTLILMIEFYRRWRTEGADPPAALRDAQLWLRDTPNVEIVRMYRQALEAEADWLSREAAITVLSDLLIRPEEERTYSTIDAWAGLAYIGA
ncbi:CHAT domain-containing protein [Nonomuraea guangzhouensis]|uniref:CHAT domain-containing protein n=1 Tax=Nonomuraea guangzhouensis TaxID=1291555 RepID=A0ABW4GRX6_9ACTN|nr:CHAT domain-containing protein [Nonomuraea guangzhouensis]